MTIEANNRPDTLARPRRTGTIFERRPKGIIVSAEKIQKPLNTETANKPQPNTIVFAEVKDQLATSLRYARSDQDNAWHATHLAFAERIIEHIQNDKSSYEIAALLGISATKVRDILGEIESVLGVTFPRKKGGRPKPERTTPKRLTRTKDEVEAYRRKEIALRKKGLTYREIAARLGVANSTVIADLRDIDEIKDVVVKPKNPVYKPSVESQKLITQIEDLKRETSLSNSQIAARLGISKSSVRNYVIKIEARLGITFPRAKSGQKKISE